MEWTSGLTGTSSPPIYLAPVCWTGLPERSNMVPQTWSEERKTSSGKSLDWVSRRTATGKQGQQRFGNFNRKATNTDDSLRPWKIERRRPILWDSLGEALLRTGPTLTMVQATGRGVQLPPLTTRQLLFHPRRKLRGPPQDLSPDGPATRLVSWVPSNFHLPRSIS